MLYYLTEKEAITLKNIIDNGYDTTNSVDYIKLGDSRVKVKTLSYGTIMEFDVVKSVTFNCVMRVTSYVEDADKGQKYIRFYNEDKDYIHFNIFSDYVVKNQDTPIYMTLNEQSKVEAMLNNENDNKFITSLHGWTCHKTSNNTIQLDVEGISIKMNTMVSTGKKRVYFENDKHCYLYFASKPEPCW